MWNALKTKVSERYPEMVKWRRHLHQNPELSYRESATSGFIADTLKSFGLDVATGIGGYGVTALIRGGRPGPTVALRADMDALPIQDGKACSYASRVPGVMHACGHDGHTAALLGTGKLLAEMSEQLSGNVLLIFQPAEEVAPGGAQAMIRDGVLEGVDEIYGVHLWTPLPSGIVATCSGPMMASVDDFDLEIRGKGGHGGMPHETVDSLVVGAHLVVNLQTVISRNLNPIKPGVVTVAALQSGNSYNVIPDKAYLKGTVRTFDPITRKLARERIEAIISGTCSMFGAEHTLNYKVGYPPVVNSPAETERLQNVLRGVLGTEAVREAEMNMPAEDFSYYLERVPGCFLFVGAGGEGAEYPHHHPMFDLREEAIGQAALVLASAAISRLNGSAASKAI
ncbi:M20 family metallopeptidase [Gorillibacterium timonense]|uniref:M20 family metallopeptidase n=1 Tax=Gorillibacterium timonense TaxID=1689269 RepID=UPI00071D4CFA|nr:M20 family metallopeptidase [Gorillibacterium timonense]